MKLYKSIMAIILAAVISMSFAACKAKPVSPEESTEPSTVVVTDKNGEAVTDKDGNTVTEIVTENPESVNVSEQESKLAEDSTKKSKKKDKKKNKKEKESTTEAQTTQPVTKVKNPNTVKEIKVSNVTDNSLTLSWEGVTCDFYELEYKYYSAERWEVVDDSLKSTSINITGLTSLTKYSFRLRAIIKHKAGNSESNWTEISAKTKAQEITRKIKIKVQLPARNNDEDVLLIYLKEKDKKAVRLVAEKINFDGSVYEFETKDEYKGTVTVIAKLKNIGKVEKVKTDKETCLVDVSVIGMDMIIGEDDD